MQNKIIRERWINSLFELANYDYQKRLWNAEIENEVGDFTECVCKYFDDLNLDIGYSDFVSEGIILKDDADIVAELHAEFKKYVDKPEKQNLSDKNVLKDVEWKNLTQLALETWNRLKTETKNEKIRSLMVETENHYAQKTPPNRVDGSAPK